MPCSEKASTGLGPRRSPRGKSEVASQKSEVAAASMSRGPSALVSLAVAFVLQAPPQKFVPTPVQPSDLVVRLEPIGTMPAPVNPTSPAVAGSRLILIDQAGTLSVWNGERAEPLLGAREVPAGLKL